MKLLLIFVLIGVAVASFNDVSYKGKKDPDQLKEEIGNKISGVIEKLLGKLQTLSDKGVTKFDKILNKVKRLSDKLSDLQFEISDKIKELVEGFKDKNPELYQKIREGLNLVDEDTSEGEGEGDASTEAEVAYAKRPDELKEEIGNKLSGVIEKLLGKLQTLSDKGVTKFDKILNKVKRLSDKLSDLEFEISDKIKELVEGFKDKNPELYQKIREGLNLVDGETSEGEGEASTEAQVAYADYSLKNVFKKLRKFITEIVDKEALKQEVEKLFGKGTELAERIIDLIKEKGEEGKKKLLELIDRALEDKEPQRSVSDLYEKLKDYFKNLNLELKEKYSRFGQWVKDTLGKGLDGTKDRVQNLKKIAREFLEHAKDVRKEVATEALEFLRLYKDDLGSLWHDVRDKVKQILNKHE